MLSYYELGVRHFSMLLKPDRVWVASSLPPDVVRDRLRERAKEWRESALTSTARDAGILGWVVREKSDRIILRAQISGRNSFMPHFVGVVHPYASGSCVKGELRLNWFSRLLMLGWLAGVAIAPLLALVEPVPDATLGERLSMGVFMIPPLAALFVFGLWMVRHSSRPLATAIVEVLNAAACSTVSQPQGSRQSAAASP